MNILHLTNGIFAPSGPLPGYYSSEVTLLQTWACQTAIAAANMPLYEPRRQFGRSRQRTGVFLRDKRTHYLVLQYLHCSFSLLLIHGRSAFPDFSLSIHACIRKTFRSFSPPLCTRNTSPHERPHLSHLVPVVRIACQDNTFTLPPSQRRHCSVANRKRKDNSTCESELLAM